MKSRLTVVTAALLAGVFLSVAPANAADLVKVMTPQGPTICAIADNQIVGCDPDYRIAIQIWRDYDTIRHGGTGGGDGGSS